MAIFLKTAVHVGTRAQIILVFGLPYVITCRGGRRKLGLILTKECHGSWLRLRHAVILVLNDRTSASKKINGMALILTLTVSTTAFERTKENSVVFGRLNMR